MSCRKGAEMHRWTEEERAKLAEVAPGRSHAEIREIMTDEFGDHFGGTRIKAAMKRYRIRTGRTGRFEKGSVPPNKGKTWDEFMPPESQERCRAAHFMKGHLPHNSVNGIGYERVNRDGYTEVKVKDGRQHEANDNFRMKHHIVYEQHHGGIPEGCNIVFSDHDKQNFDPENLVAVPRSLWAVISHRHIEYWDAESLQLAMNIARLDRARFAAECRPKACRDCGEEFKLSQPRQARCGRCIAERRAHGRGA